MGVHWSFIVFGQFFLFDHGISPNKVLIGRVWPKLDAGYNDVVWFISISSIPN